MSSTHATGRWRAVGGALAALVSISVLAACSGGPAEQGEDVLDQVMQRGTVRVGECMGLPPYGMYNAQNEPEGYDIDLANLIGEELGVEVEIVDTSVANRIPALQTDQVDVVLCNTTRTLERATQVAFTDTYTVAGSTLLTKEDSDIASVADLDGKRVAVVKGTPFGELIAQAAPNAEVVELDVPSDGVVAVQQGQVDALVEDSNFLQYQASLAGGMKVTEDSLTPLYYNSFAVKHGSPKWLAWLDEFLFQLNVTGQNAELHEKWFGGPLPFELNPQY